MDFGFTVVGLSSCVLLIHYACRSSRMISASAKPRLRRGEDPFVTNSIYRRAWEREERKRCAAMRRAGICLVRRDLLHSRAKTYDGCYQFEGWQDGLLDIRMVQAMLSGCVVATVVPEIEHGVSDCILVIFADIARSPRPAGLSLTSAPGTRTTTTPSRSHQNGPLARIKHNT